MRFHSRALAIAALAAVSLPALAVAQTLSVTDIDFEGENGLKVSIPTLEATGSNLDEAAIRGLFGGGLAQAAQTLSTLDAESIHIPTLTISSPTVPGAEAMTTTYSDFTLIGVSGGVASSATLGGAAVDGGTGTAVTIGPMSTDLLDLGAIAGFYGYAEATDEMTPVYSNFVMDGMEFAGPGFTCSIGAARAGEFRARPLKGTLDELMQWTTEIEAAQASGGEPPVEAIRAAVAYYVDLLTAFESSPSTLDGLECSGADEDGKAVAVTAGPMTVGGFTPGIYPDLELSALRVDVADEGWMEFGRFVWKQMDLNGPIAAVKAAEAELSPAWFEANWRQLVPALAGLTIEGFGMDVPSDDPAMPRVQASIGRFDVSLTNYVNGIPADIATSASDVVVSMPADASAALSALGIDTLNLGYDLAARWDETSSTIALDRFAITGDRLGALSLSGTIGNAGPELFAADPNVAMAAAMTLTLKDLTISVGNDGFAPALIAFAALEQHQPPEALHLAFTGMAQAMPLALLGTSPEAMQLSEALGAFFNGTPNLTVTLTAVDPAGITLPELMAAQENPQLLQGKVTVTAEASGEPVPFVFPDLSGLAVPPQPAVPTPEEPAPAEPTPQDEAVPTAPPPPGELSRADEKAGNKQ